MDAAELEATLFKHVSEQFCRRVLRMIFDARRRSWDYCASEFPSTEADNLRPWWTRAKVESGLRDVADLHAADGVTYQVLKAAGSGWNHTEVMSGPILVTAGAVQSPCGPVNKADFRLGLAVSNQGSLFETGPFGSHLYVMLLHSGYRSLKVEEQRKYGHLAASAYLAFPASDLDSNLHEINLFDRYPEVVEANLPQEWDQEAVVKFMYRARRSSWPTAS